jgi:hypothetical protein
MDQKEVYLCGGNDTRMQLRQPRVSCHIPVLLDSNLGTSDMPCHLVPCHLFLPIIPRIFQASLSLAFSCSSHIVPLTIPRKPS